MKPGLPVWRSLLYVPVNVDKYVDKAHTRGADCIQLDLEDSVPASEKDRARTLVAAAAARVRRGGADVVVRINRPLALAVRDIEACVGPDVNGIAVTKVEGAEHLRLLDELVSGLESTRGLPHGHTRFIAMIETPAAYFRMPEIAAAVERTAAMNIGGEDFALEAGMEPAEETLLLPKQQMIFAARSAGIMPLGYIASVAGYGDWPAFRAMVKRSRQYGFMGASCIHPGQVPIVNECYTPPADEVAYAKRVVEENAKAEALGRASFAIDGKMIDVPVVLRAERLLARSAAIEQREAAKRAA
ncbi:MAG: CoA ester lyase [Betaproteobacteria bacterium]|nr:CoA ester lyase [Betaproteobacteria bacterium]